VGDDFLFVAFGGDILSVFFCLHALLEENETRDAAYRLIEAKRFLDVGT